MMVHTMGAIIDGVEVRSPHWIVGVCRRGDGSLVSASVPVEPMDTGAGAWPFIRGVVCQLRQLYPPASLRDWSAALAEGNEIAAAPESRGQTFRRSPAEHEIVAREELRGAPRVPSAGPLVVALLWASIWMAVPQVLAAWAFALAGRDPALVTPEFQIATVVFQLGLTIVYLRTIGRSSDVRRIFQYNTAALKVLVAHETYTPLNVESVRRQSPIHPYSSANYIGFACALLPVVFYFASRPLVSFDGSRLAFHAAFVALKMVTLPVVLALTYEVQQVAVRLFRAGRVRGLWPVVCALQLTVNEEPNDEQIEVALMAMREAFLLEGDTEGRARA